MPEAAALITIQHTTTSARWLTPARSQLHDVKRGWAPQLLPGGHAPDANHLHAGRAGREPMQGCGRSMLPSRLMQLAHMPQRRQPTHVTPAAAAATAPLQTFGKSRVRSRNRRRCQKHRAADERKRRHWWRRRSISSSSRRASDGQGFGECRALPALAAANHTCLSAGFHPART